MKPGYNMDEFERNKLNHQISNNGSVLIPAKI